VVSRRQRLGLFLLLVGAAVLLCSHIRYATLWAGVLHLDTGILCSALPKHVSAFSVALGVAAAAMVYGALLPRIYGSSDRIRRKGFLTISIASNLAILGFFKYCDFFVANFAALLASLGVADVDVRLLGIVLPPGISFYTFQAMSYTIDVYRGEAEPTADLRDFALFVCFFPHLVAGPIMRASNFLPQVVRPRARRPGAMEEGLVLVLLGLFKKIVVADNLARIVNLAFFPFESAGQTVISGPEVLIGIYAFAFQIYGDFSGYSSVARGIAKWLGFELTINFRTPYFAVSPSDFWRRWHISLSSWLRDYLYIPLGGNRFGVVREYRNLMMTMILGGLWHGARWTFVVWGFYHGLVLCAFRALGIRDAPRWSARWVLQAVFMFHVVCLGWLFFRAPTLAVATAMLERTFTDATITPLTVSMAGLVVFYVLPLLALEAFTAGEEGLDRLLAWSWPRQGLAYAYLVLMLVLFPAVDTVEFIYFQF